MIEKLKTNHQYGWDGANGGSIYETAPNNLEITKKINEIIDYINNQEQIRTEVAIQDIKKDIERAKIEAINNSQMAMLNGRYKYD